MQLQNACHVSIRGKAVNSTDQGRRDSWLVIMVWHLRNCWLLKKALAGMRALLNGSSEMKDVL